MEVGLALAEIRDLRLYRREYSGFAEYCREKWGWTRQHAYRLIEAAPVGKCNTRVTSIRQAVALANSRAWDSVAIATFCSAGRDSTTAAAVISWVQ